MGIIDSNPMKRKRGIQLKPIHYVAGLVVLIILYIIASTLIFGNPVYKVTSQQSFTLTQNKSIFLTLSNSSRTTVVFLKNSSNSSAILYVTEYPVLSSPVIAVTLGTGSSANVSSSATQLADMHITLTSSSPSQAILQVTPVSQGLGVKTSGNIYIMNPGSLSGGTPASNVVIPTVTTTAAATTGTGSSTTAASTTTVVGQTPAQQVMPLVNATPLGELMIKYNNIYVKSTECTAPTYNSTYLSKIGSEPSGPNSFVNVSAITPTSLNLNVTKTGTSTFNVTYSSVSSSSATSGPAVVIIYSLSTNSITSQTFKGIYQGGNYTELNSTYNSFNNDCDVLIP